MTPTPVAILLPNTMAVRNVLASRVLEGLARAGGLALTFITPFEDDQETVASAGGEHLAWRDLGNPQEGPDPGLWAGPAGVVIKRLINRVAMRGLRPWCGFGNLVYRFNEIHGFFGL